MSAAIALAMEQQNQKLLVETQLDITELDNLLQPIIDTCTKDAISVRQSSGSVFSACGNLVSPFRLSFSGWEELDVQQR